MSHLRNARAQRGKVQKNKKVKKKMRLRKSKVKTMFIIFYDSDGIKFVPQDKI